MSEKLTQAMMDETHARFYRPRPEPSGLIPIFSGVYAMMASQLVDSAVEETRVFWRRKLEASDQEAAEREETSPAEPPKD